MSLPGALPSQPMIVKCFSKCISCCRARFSRPSTQIPTWVVGWLYLTHMAATGGDFLVEHLAYIHPMIWLIGIEEIDLTHLMGRDAITQLLRKVQPSTRRCNRIKGT